jgi:acyl-homoserine-lactone acylase
MSEGKMETMYAACRLSRQVMITFGKSFILLFLAIPMMTFKASGAHGATYRAEITRTAYGIPHIIANTWEGLGYGHGYAYAQDNFCVLMREIVIANGQSAEFFGEHEGDLHSDFVMQLLNRGVRGHRLMELIEMQPDSVRALVDGYAKGLNRYLRETGVDSLPVGPAACRGEAWVRPITPLDLWQYYRKIALEGSGDNRIVREALIAATGPSAARASATDVAEAVHLSANAVAQFAALARSLSHASGGSNAIALGREATRTGSATRNIP